MWCGCAGAEMRASTLARPARRSADPNASLWLTGVEASAVPWQRSTGGRSAAAPMSWNCCVSTTASGELRGRASAARAPLRPASMMAHITSR